MAVEFVVEQILPAPASTVYSAWLDAEKHSEMTGAEAVCRGGVCGTFTAWDGYIEGKTLEVEEGRRILQSWRTAEFSEEDDSSMLEITFEPANDGACRVKIHHWNLPKDGLRYKRGWKEHYFRPMLAYFGNA